MRQNLFKRSRGFTLIEMLIGLSIFAVVAASLHSVFFSAFTISRRTETVNQAYRQARWSIDRMARDLQRMVLYQSEDFYPGKAALEALPGEISFLVAENDGLKVVRYFLSEPEYGSVHRTVVRNGLQQPDSILVQSQQTWDVAHLAREEVAFVNYVQLEDKKSIDADQSETLSKNVKGQSLRFFFAYLEKEEESSTIVWKETWSETFLPLGIRVEMQFFAPGEEENLLALKRDVFIPLGSWGRPEEI